MNLNNLKEYTNSLVVDEKCKKYFKEVLHHPDDFIRIAVESGGCSGFSYAFYINDIPSECDFLVVISDDPLVVTDNISAEFMKNAIIKYDDTPLKTRVYVDNPMATSSCGCGESFYCEE